MADIQVGAVYSVSERRPAVTLTVDGKVVALRLSDAVQIGTHLIMAAASSAVDAAAIDSLDDVKVGEAQEILGRLRAARSVIEAREGV